MNPTPRPTLYLQRLDLDDLGGEVELVDFGRLENELRDAHQAGHMLGGHHELHDEYGDEPNGQQDYR